MRLPRRLGLAGATASAVLVLSGSPLAAPVPAGPPVFGAGRPAFVVSAVPAGSPEADIAGEPSVGVDWRTGSGLYQADATTYRLQLGTDRQPATVTWTPAASPYSHYNADPILATDPRSGLTLAGGDDLACGVMSTTRDDGTSWAPSLPCTLAADHPTVGFGPGTGGREGPIAYFCQQTSLDVCTTSANGGTTWSAPVAVPGCQGKFGHVKAARDGAVYLPFTLCGSSPLSVGGAVSTDNAATWRPYTLPGAPSPARGFDPTVAVTPDGTVYESWARDGDYHPVVSWSHDMGRTWTPPLDLAGTASPAVLASTFQAAVAGDDGRVAVAFLGTAVGTPGVNPFDSGYHGVWNLYVATTYDGGASWTSVVAPGGPVQRGTIADGGTTSLVQRNLLDFMDAAVTKDGRVLVGFADGCLGACKGPAGTEAMSQADNYATVALQTSGRGLFRAFDVAGPPPAGPRVRHRTR